VLNIWFPQQQGTRYLLLPNSTAANSSAAAATIAQLQKQQQAPPNGSDTEILPLEQIEGILLLSYRRFFSSINARDDYSFLETPVVPATASSSDNSGKPIVRRQREANSQLPAYWGGRLAWGSPPIAKKVGDQLDASFDYCFTPLQSLTQAVGCVAMAGGAPAVLRSVCCAGWWRVVCILVCQQREANAQLPAFWGGRLAWGSPSIAKKVGCGHMRYALAMHRMLFQACAECLTQAVGGVAMSGDAPAVLSSVCCAVMVCGLYP
jgi:hypothetical protein